MNNYADYVHKLSHFLYICLALLMCSCSTMYMPPNHSPTLIKGAKQASFSASVGLNSASSKIAISPAENFVVVGSSSQNIGKQDLTKKTFYNKDFEIAIGYYNTNDTQIHVEVIGGYGFQKFENMAYNRSQIDEGIYRKFFIESFCYLGRPNYTKLGISMRFTNLYSEINPTYYTATIFSRHKKDFTPYTMLWEPGIFFNCRVQEKIYFNTHCNLCVSHSGERYYSYQPFVWRVGVQLLVY
ncbi:MAG: hypothetical protein HYZ42_18705 [Bacteroidetes bacterium]|nr:hypothetical protein [Bacteroidota bacterium]